MSFPDRLPKKRVIKHNKPTKSDIIKSVSLKSKLTSAKHHEKTSAEEKQALVHSRISKRPAGKENRKGHLESQVSKQERNAVEKKPKVKKPANVNAICVPKKVTGKRRHRDKKPAKERTTGRHPKSNEDVQRKEPEIHCTHPLDSDLLIQSGKTLQSLRQLAGKASVPMTGNKMQLQQRIQWYDKFKLNSSIIDPARPVRALDGSGFVDDITFQACDENLQNSLKWLTALKIFAYFLKRSARQGYRNGKLLKKAGFLRNMCYAKVNDETYQVRCYCAAAMHKNRVYLVKLEHNGYLITKTNCECPAGSGNSAACKHVGALLDALQEFVKTGNVQQNETCTDVLQTWHRPPKNADKSSMYKPIKELYLDPHSTDSPRITEVSRCEFTEYFMNTTLNAGLNMAIHRSRNVKDMHCYQEDHSYPKILQVQEPIDVIENDS